MNIKERYLTSDDKDLLSVCLKSDYHPYTKEMEELLSKISDMVIELSLNWFSEVFGKDMIDSFCKANKSVVRLANRYLLLSFNGVETVKLFWDNDSTPRYPSQKFGILKTEDIQKYYLREDEVLSFDRNSTVNPKISIDAIVRLPNVNFLISIAEEKGLDDVTIDNLRRFTNTIPLSLILKDSDQAYVLLDMINRYTHCVWVLSNCYRSFEVYEDDQFLKDIKSWEELKIRYPEWYDLLIEAKKREKEKEILKQASTIAETEGEKYKSKVEVERKQLLDFSEKSLESVLLDLRGRLQDLSLSIPSEGE